MRHDDARAPRSEDLPPADEYRPCPACGHQRTREIKLQVRYCSGAPRPDQVCEMGGEAPHLHRSCLTCGYEWAEALPEQEAPLTVWEIRVLRQIISQHPGLTREEVAAFRAAFAEPPGPESPA